MMFKIVCWDTKPFPGPLQNSPTKHAVSRLNGSLTPAKKNEFWQPAYHVSSFTHGMAIQNSDLPAYSQTQGLVLEGLSRFISWQIML
jgi:hypothetical protein